MRNMHRTIALAHVAALSLAAALALPARAALVTFDDVVNGSPNQIRTAATSGGFDFASTHFHVIDTPTICSFGGCVANGTQYAWEDAPTLAGPVTMTKSGGGAFSLFSFDGAEAFLNDASAALGGFPNAAIIHVVGNLSGGGNVTANFTLDGVKDGAGGLPDFQHFLFGPEWTNLVSVVWSGMLATGAPASMAFDNIDTTGIPEPSSLLLIGSGLLGFAARRRANT